MKKPYDLTGNVYNGITMIEIDWEKSKEKNNNKIYWKAICHCGKEFSSGGYQIKSGKIKSCGCLIGGKGISKNGKQNEWITKNNIAIGITKKGEEFIIDTDDLDKVKPYCWRKDAYGYIVANSKNCTNTIIQLHRIIMNPNKGELVDHINWDKSDNTKANLRICTKSQNNVNIKKKSNNTSGYTGVKHSPNGKWKAQISLNNNRIHLGTFETIEGAVKARKKAELVLHKEFNGEINRQDFIKMIKEVENYE